MNWKRKLNQAISSATYIFIGVIFLASMYFGACFFKFQEVTFNVETARNNSVLLILTIAILFVCIMLVWNIYDRKSFEKKILHLIVSMKSDIANSEDNLVKISRNLEDEILSIYDKLNNRGVVLDEGTGVSKESKVDSSQSSE